MGFDRAVCYPLSIKPSVWERIKAAAEKVGKPTSEFIREAALAATEKVEQETEQQAAASNQ